MTDVPRITHQDIAHPHQAYIGDQLVFNMVASDEPCDICGEISDDHWTAIMTTPKNGTPVASFGHEWTNVVVDEEPTMDFDPDNILDPAVTPEAYIYKAKLLAAISCYRRGLVEQMDEMPSPDEFYITWFSKTLQNWKALVSTDLEPGLYWEITYNGNKQESYVDFYQKIDNFAMTDAELIFDLEDDDED